jgi:exosortase A
MATPRDEIALQERGESIAVRWRVRLLIAAFLIVMLGVYWPTTLALSELWLDTGKTTYTHGFIVLAISMWLILRDERFEQLDPPQNNFGALLAYVACSLGWLVAYRAGIETAHELAFPVLAWLAICSFFGVRSARLAFFPIAFIFFAIPVWDVLNEHLQTISAAMVGYMLHLSGISAYVDGNLVHIGVGTFEIAGGCSGLHFVMVALALGALYGELSRDSIKTRAILVGLALFLALAANWVRVYVIVVAGYLTNMQHYLVRVEHYKFGWLVFAVMMTLFFWIASRVPSAGRADNRKAETGSAERRPSRLVYAALGLLIVPSWSAFAPHSKAPNPPDSEMRPQPLEGWSVSKPATDANWRPAFVGADAESLTGYEAPNGTLVVLYVAAYREQKQDKELLGYHNRIINDSESILDSRSLSRSVHECVVQDGSVRHLLRFSYHIGDLQTASGLVAQLAYGVKSIWSAPVSRIVAVRTRCASDCEAERQTLDAFASSLPSTSSAAL